MPTQLFYEYLSNVQDSAVYRKKGTVLASKNLHLLREKKVGKGFN